MKGVIAPVFVVMIIIAGAFSIYFDASSKSSLPSFDPVVANFCALSRLSSQTTCSFTTNPAPAGYYALVLGFDDPSLSYSYCSYLSQTGLNRYNGYYNGGIDVWYAAYATPTSVSLGSGAVCEIVLIEIDFVPSTYGISAYAAFCGHINPTRTWIAVINNACGQSNQLSATSAFIWYASFHNVAGTFQCSDPYCAVYLPNPILSDFPAIEFDGGQSGLGWTGGPCSCNLSAVSQSGANVGHGLLVQIAPVAQNGVVGITQTVTQTQIQLVAPSPTQIQFWLLPLMFILGIGALMLLIGVYAGMRGSDTFMLFILGAFIGSIIGAMANIIPLALVIMIGLVFAVLVWRKVA
jgi:hypothetical protein